MNIALLLLLAAALPPLVKTGEVQRAGKTVRLPGLIVHDVASPYIEIPAKVARTNDLLEFIAVEPQGRDYESLLTVECKPSAMQFALLLIGCETGTVANANSRVQIEVEHNNQRLPVEQWLIDRKTKKPPTGLRWVFNGSYFTKHPVTDEPVFLSDAEQAHIVLWWQPSIVVNLADDRGNPYRGDDQGFEANPAAVPPAGTPVKLILRKAQK